MGGGGGGGGGLLGGIFFLFGFYFGGIIGKNGLFGGFIIWYVDVVCKYYFGGLIGGLWFGEVFMIGKKNEVVMLMVCLLNGQFGVQVSGMGVVLNINVFFFQINVIVEGGGGSWEEQEENGCCVVDKVNEVVEKKFVEWIFN